jgi:hypothetical protein
MKCFDIKNKKFAAFVFFGICMHQQIAFSKRGYEDEDFEVASPLKKTVVIL